MRRLLLTLLVLTVLALVIDLARPAWTDPARRLAADVAAPAQQALAGWDDTDVEALTSERDALALRVGELERQLAGDEETARLRRSEAGEGRDLVPARVVAVASGTAPVGARTVTIDVGTADGVGPDLTVISADGLVGRVLQAASSTSDVLLLGDTGVVVGVRFGEPSALGAVDARPAPGLPARGHGELTLTAVGDSAIAVGDQVSTLGSPDDRPYVAGVPLGTVTAVDPDTGQLGRTAVVEPRVDTDTLDVVAVVLGDGDS